MCMTFMIGAMKPVSFLFDQPTYIKVNINVMRQPVCLVINQITVDGYAALFNCTPADRASDSMMAPT